MPSFQDSAVLVVLALLLFGPKKLPVLARQLGKLMADFRKASNEFRTQMEEELRISEQTDRQKQVAAIEASAPAIAAPAEPVPPSEPSIAAASESTPDPASEYPTRYPEDPLLEPVVEPVPESAPSPVPEPLPIAVSGELSILPPSTGLPIANTPSLAESNGNASNGNDPAAHPAELETEILHG